MNPTAYAVLAELVVIRDIKHRESMTAPEYDEFCARYDAAYAAARACVARGDVATVPREPTEAMLLTVQRLLPRWEAKAMWGAMHDAATKENAK